MRGGKTYDTITLRRFSAGQKRRERNGHDFEEPLTKVYKVTLIMEEATSFPALDAWMWKRLQMEARAIPQNLETERKAFRRIPSLDVEAQWQRESKAENEQR